MALVNQALHQLLQRNKVCVSNIQGSGIEHSRNPVCISRLFLFLLPSPSMRWLAHAFCVVLWIFFCYLNSFFYCLLFALLYVSPWVFSECCASKKDQRFLSHIVYTHMHTMNRVLNQVWNCSHARIKIWMKFCTGKRILSYFDTLVLASWGEYTYIAWEYV